ncbi:uncharacterized protein LOC121372616 [Gigantopelta aegis]|uniref:uncharacterized protein LOC121372616 n=1 Tax=Gigantopelta aegis TaxID=1735272 RepID=UPI001B8890D7|nr:uncharacterized protein LOC121372616 [Gigantopelta aegis]XP_041354975.1 uncharacterized protein LOC121372616 [Gigantopelta aegis]
MDHSETHFENERLSEELEDTVDTIHRYKHRQFISRAFEIMELKKTLAAFQSMTKSNQKPDKLLPRRSRPTSSFSSVVKVNVRLPAETGDKEESDSDNDLSSSDDSSFCRSGKGEKKSKIVSKPERAKPVVGRRNSPSDWYARMLVSRDVPLRRPASSLPTVGPRSTRCQSKPARAKSAFPRTTTTETSTVMSLNGANDSPEKGMKLVCNRRRVVSASMSRRQLKELCHQDLVGEESEEVDVMKARQEKHRLEAERLQMRVKLFLKSMDNWACSSKKTIRSYY